MVDNTLCTRDMDGPKRNCIACARRRWLWLIEKLRRYSSDMYGMLMARYVYATNLGATCIRYNKLLTFPVALPIILFAVAEN